MAFNAFFTDMILPFLLVFVVVFAILQKSKILGDGKRQIDALVALVLGLLLIGLEQPREIVVGIMPWLAVGLAVMLVFFILYGFAVGDEIATAKPWMKWTFGILAGLFTIGVVLYVTGFYNVIAGWFSGAGSTSDFWLTVIMVVIVIGAVVFAVLGGGEKKSSSSD